jgi:hypothetical protein
MIKHILVSAAIAAVTVAVIARVPALRAAVLGS